MIRSVIMATFALLILAACSGGVETVTIQDISAAPPKDTVTSTESRPPKDTVPAIDTVTPASERELEIVTLLPKDAIPAIDDPVFISADEANLQYEPDELVIGVQFNGDARAYSIPTLSSHEIVNDTVGGQKIAVTW